MSLILTKRFAWPALRDFSVVVFNSQESRKHLRQRLTVPLMQELVDLRTKNSAKCQWKCLLVLTIHLQMLVDRKWFLRIPGVGRNNI